MDTGSHMDGSAGARQDLRVAIIGGGMSGICMSIALKKAGFDSFTIYEKYDNVGGTWRDNTYPGIACDVPSHLYSFSFELNPDWSRLFSPGSEIQDYFERCADKYGINPHVRLNTEIADARFDEEAGLWHLKTAAGEETTAHIVVSAVGALHKPHYPDIPGLDNFRGTMFHSARWNHTHDLKGRKVAVIGSAASAVQIVPLIAPQAGHLYVLQRTANWILPRRDFAYPEAWKRAFRRLPFLNRLHRWMIYWMLEARFPAFKGKKWAVRRIRKICSDHLMDQVADPGMRAALTPDYDPGCKRVLLTDDYYPALQRDNVTLETSAIDRIAPDGIVMKDGRTIGVDTIILATGFYATDPLAPMKVTGKGGLPLVEAWRDGAEAHMTVALAGFPNFYTLLGPNSGLGHNSVIFMVESQVRYVMQCLEKIVSGGLRYLAPKKEASDAFNAAIQKDLAETTWKSGCSSWYQDDNGKVIFLWPYSTVKYWKDLRKVKFDEYEEAM